MKRVWKPLDIGVGLRLYRVRMHFCERPSWDKDFIVVASSPSHAARLMEDMHKDTEWIDKLKPDFKGYALNIYRPANEDLGK
jgi:hypothetical protein